MMGFLKTTVLVGCFRVKDSKKAPPKAAERVLLAPKPGL
jgi:hypothetical protein